MGYHNKDKDEDDDNFYDEDSANFTYREMRRDWSRQHRPRSRKGDELEGGTVLDCSNCNFAYYSIYYVSRPYRKDRDKLQILPPIEKRVCERCVRNALFNKNILNLSNQ